MEYKIETRQGITFDLTLEEAEKKDFLSMLNNQQLIAIDISDSLGLNKRNINAVVPKDAVQEIGEGVYRLNTSDGATYLTKLIEGDSVSNAVQRVNDRQTDFVLIGDVMIQSRNFDFIVPTT